ncbi:WhiB family transcriptional regulator [Microbispora sp. NPDC049633]|uniref:WhiB family transcriptional regulator n=1 Tax=Microbispora sp. NPDC049633 TaxID=3154355 RepID=UPI0034149020
MVLKPRIPAPDWFGGGNEAKAAKCIKFRAPRRGGKDPWFDRKQADDCVEFCNGDADGRVCPLRHACLEWAVINNEATGIWGGMHPHDRRNIRFARKEDPYLEITWHPPTPKIPDLDEDDFLLEDDEDEDELLV